MGAGLFGAIFGSFLNVVIWRMPRGESVVKPRSRCPGCGATLRAVDNVPVLSWFALRGKCHNCGERISARYPLVELLTAALLVAVVLTADPPSEAWLGAAFMLLLVPITFIDLDHRIIPNKLTGPGAILAIALVAILDADALPEHLIAGAAAGGFLFIAWFQYPRGMGMGDVKLAGMMGLFLGRSVGPAMLVALVAGSVLGAAIMARLGTAEGRKVAVPFGPFLALGGVVGWFAGDPIVDWYLDTFA